ncbi:MAG: 4Fe-4S dicluster domain-containing protein [Candidatus Eisenbacteria bacterium]|nr:4Fe-4S dicluster domain-containing protein [Candidatus Eisenbacteria bacterium]
MKGGQVDARGGIQAGITSFLKEALSKGCFDAVMIPTRVPAGDSFAWILTDNEDLVAGASPLPPVMPVQGARALSSITKKGKAPAKIAAVMRPCEVRAAVELGKLKQVDLANVTLLSMDCPGVLELSTYLSDPTKGDSEFSRLLDKWDAESLRPVCRSCTHFSATASDIHLGLLGAQAERLYVMPLTPEGSRVTDALNISADQELDSWQAKVDEVRQKREEQRRKSEVELKERVEGTEKLLATLSTCIGCRNCMRVCPICYCRQCFFDSDALEGEVAAHLSRAERKGSLRFPLDTLLFHLGRMSHMSLSCVECGTCEDACPMSIPVGQIFSHVARRTQELFKYDPGKNRYEPLPLVTYEQDELHDFEQPYVKTYSGKGAADA